MASQKISNTKLARNGRLEKQKRQKNSKMADINPTLTVITLNVTRLNSNYKIGINEMNIKRDPIVCCLQEACFTFNKS